MLRHGWRLTKTAKSVALLTTAWWIEKSWG